MNKETLETLLFSWEEHDIDSEKFEKLKQALAEDPKLAESIVETGMLKSVINELNVRSRIQEKNIHLATHKNSDRENAQHVCETCPASDLTPQASFFVRNAAVLAAGFMLTLALIIINYDNLSKMVSTSEKQDLAEERSDKNATEKDTKIDRTKNKTLDFDELPEISLFDLSKEPEVRRRIYERLRTKVSVDFKKARLLDVVADLKKISGLNIVVDPDFLKDVVDKIEIDLQFQDMTLFSILNWVAYSFDSKYRLIDSVIFFENKNATNMANDSVLIAYDISWLHDKAYGDSDISSKYTSLEKLISSTIFPKEFQYLGITLSIKDDKAAIAIDRDNHKTIQSLLSFIKNKSNVMKNISVARLMYYPKLHPVNWRQALSKKLQRNFSIKLNAVEFDFAVKKMSSLLDISLQVSPFILKQNITFELDHVRGDQALALFSKLIKSTYIFSDEAIFLSYQADTEEMPTVIIYDLAKLFPTLKEEQLDRIVKSIRTSVMPYQWIIDSRFNICSIGSLLFVSNIESVQRSVLSAIYSFSNPKSVDLNSGTE